MSNQLISMPVFVEDSGETMILKLSPQDAARATKGKEINKFLYYDDGVIP